jgi:hypothetical protein
MLRRMSDQKVLTINQSDFLIFIDRSLDKMLSIVEELGDGLANLEPELPGANSPYGILTHCIGVIDYWMGNLIGDRGFVRDRPAEFAATGTAAEIRVRVEAVKQRLREDVSKIDGPAGLSEPLSGYNPAGGPDDWTQGAALIHTYEELAQHLGHMDITRDLLVRGG